MREREGRAGEPPPVSESEAKAAQAAASGASDSGARVTLFRDAAAESGLVFTYFNGGTGRYYYPEVMGAGVAVFDYDNDGDLDVYFGQGHLLGADTSLTDAVTPPPVGSPAGDRLFRNDLALQVDGSRKLQFVDVTGDSGIVAEGYAMGAAVGDYDNDGWIDLYVTNFGANQLWRNNGDGTFSAATASGVAGDEELSTSAAFVDFDLDGWLDLVVCDYVDFTLKKHKNCFAASGLPDYCGPAVFDPMPNRLYRNLGDGSFEDVSLSSGLGHARGRTLGVVVSDFDDDGWPDIYFANDGDENELWMNGHDGTFGDQALIAGAAVNIDGVAEAGMGVDAGDFDNDGDDDIIVAHLKTETNTLYVNDGLGEFTDDTLASGLGTGSWNFTGFGAAWFDYDNDGWLDLLVVNGEVRINPVLVQQGDPFPLDQPNLLFHNLGGGRFEEVSQQAGEALTQQRVSRGAAFGDLDNDGDTDIVVLNNSDPVQLLLNLIGARQHWLGVRLLGGEPPRDMLGARVRLARSDSFEVHRRARTDASYLSANDSRVLVGLGDDSSIDALRVTWLGGRSQSWVGPAADRYLVVRAGG